MDQITLRQLQYPTRYSDTISLKDRSSIVLCSAKTVLKAWTRATDMCTAIERDGFSDSLWCNLEDFLANISCISIFGAVGGCMMISHLISEIKDGLQESCTWRKHAVDIIDKMSQFDGWTSCFSNTNIHVYLTHLLGDGTSPDADQLISILSNYLVDRPDKKATQTVSSIIPTLLHHKGDPSTSFHLMTLLCRCDDGAKVILPHMDDLFHRRKEYNFLDYAMLVRRLCNYSPELISKLLEWGQIYEFLDVVEDESSTGTQQHASIMAITQILPHLDGDEFWNQRDRWTAFLRTLLQGSVLSFSRTVKESLDILSKHFALGDGIIKMAISSILKESPDPAEGCDDQEYSCVLHMWDCLLRLFHYTKVFGVKVDGEDKNKMVEYLSGYEEFLGRRALFTYFSMKGMVNKPSVLQDMQDPCSVCYEDHTIDESVVTGCGHIFHRRCISSWMDSQTERSAEITCPTCRSCGDS